MPNTTLKQFLFLTEGAANLISVRDRDFGFGLRLPDGRLGYHVSLRGNGINIVDNDGNVEFSDQTADVDAFQTVLEQRALAFARALAADLAAVDSMQGSVTLRLGPHRSQEISFTAEWVDHILKLLHQ